MRSDMSRLFVEQVALEERDHVSFWSREQTSLLRDPRSPGSGVPSCDSVCSVHCDAANLVPPAPPTGTWGARETDANTLACCTASNKAPRL